MNTDTCWDCRRNAGSVKRLDRIADRAARNALGTHGHSTTDFARASARYEAAIIRRDTHLATHQDAA